MQRSWCSCWNGKRNVSPLAHARSYENPCSYERERVDGLVSSSHIRAARIRVAGERAIRIELDRVDPAKVTAGARWFGQIHLPPHCLQCLGFDVRKRLLRFKGF